MNWAELKEDLIKSKYHYFHTDNGVLLCGDCLEVMKKMPDECVDLVLTDPPYGVRKKEKWDDKENFLNNINKWIDVCYKVTRNVVLWFCLGSMLSYILKGNESKYHRILVWDKPPGSQFAGAMHTNIWYTVEFILVFAKIIPKTNKEKRYGYDYFSYGTIPKKKYNHPTTKPLGLIEDLIYFYSNEKDVILDPFIGSGTTAVACEKLNRRWIGIEMNPEYCEITAKRLDVGSFVKQHPKKRKEGLFI